MGFLDFFKRVLGNHGNGGDVDSPAGLMEAPAADKLGLDELATRLGVTAEQLRATPVAYRRFTVPKRTGGVRTIQSPEEPLKEMQRRILYRLLGRLRCHAAARGFQRGQSIVTNALPHARAAVIIRLDVRDFFGTTRSNRVLTYFRAIGWDKHAAELLTVLCTYEDALPQGAPTSPRLSNLLNARLDARLAALAAKFGGAYTRYADDMTFSLPQDDRRAIQAVLRVAKLAARDEGYVLHQKRKLQIRRRHERQLVTGLVVNHAVRLPRATRRYLRAVRHHIATGRPATLTAQQLAGWQGLQAMIAQQAKP